MSTRPRRGSHLQQEKPQPKQLQLPFVESEPEAQEAAAEEEAAAVQDEERE